MFRKQYNYFLSAIHYILGPVWDLLLATIELPKTQRILGEGVRGRPRQNRSQLHEWFSFSRILEETTPGVRVWISRRRNLYASLSVSYQ